jgi:hypothetical protein
LVEALGIHGVESGERRERRGFHGLRRKRGWVK